MIPLSLDEITFATPWAFALVLLVLVAPALQLASERLFRRTGMGSDFVSPEMRQELLDADGRSARYRGASALAYWLCWLFLALALTRPQWGIIEEVVHQQGLDIVIAVDLSQSMEAADLQPTRIENARRELAFLTEELAGNRVGLIGFAGSSFLFCPLTLDTDAVEMFLSEMNTKAIPVPGTALGDAIRLALQTFEMGENQEAAGGSRVLLLLTDGEDHESQPLEAAKEAAEAGVVIDTVGLGTPQGAVVPSQYGGVVKDERGETVVSRLEGDVLKSISETTGGMFRRLDGTGPGLEQYLRDLQKRQTRSFGDSREVRRQERFPLCLALSALFFMLALIFEELDKRR